MQIMVRRIGTDLKTGIGLERLNGIWGRDRSRARGLDGTIPVPFGQGGYTSLGEGAITGDVEWSRDEHWIRSSVNGNEIDELRRGSRCSCSDSHEGRDDASRTHCCEI